MCCYLEITWTCANDFGRVAGSDRWWKLDARERKLRDHLHMAYFSSFSRLQGVGNGGWSLSAFGTPTWLKNWLSSWFRGWFRASRVFRVSRAFSSGGWRAACRTAPRLGWMSGNCRACWVGYRAFCCLRSCAAGTWNAHARKNENQILVLNRRSVPLSRVSDSLSNKSPHDCLLHIRFCLCGD